jgi:integrase
LPLDEIGVREVEALKAAMLKAGRSPKRVNNCLSVLNKMLKYASEVGVLESVPRIKFVKVPPQDFDFLDCDEYGRLLDASAHEPAVQAAIIAAGDAGLRLGELRALKWSRVDFVAQQVTVAEAFWRKQIGSPKGGRIGSVPMTQRLTEALHSQRHLKGQFVFSNDKGEPWTRDWMDDALKRQCRHAGLREIGWHVLRHNAGNWIMPPCFRDSWKSCSWR